MLTAPSLLMGRCSAPAEPPPDRTDVVVVGAGAIGCATAWHLRKRGLRVVVADARPSPASQSTNGAAGFVASWSAVHMGAWKKTEWEMQRYGIDFYTKLAGRATADIGFSPSGIAYVYATAGQWKKAQPKITEARKLGTRLEVLTAGRAEDVVPFLDFAKLAGVIFDPDAVRVRAGDAVRALADELRADGVEFRFGTPVAGLLRDGDRVTGVRSSAGDVPAGKVVVAAGAWTRPLLATLGVDCPATPHNETRYTTAPLPGLPPAMPLLIFADRRGHYIREERGGLLIGGGDDRPLPPDRLIDPASPPWCDKLPPDQARRVRGFVRDIAPLMPVLERAEVGEVRSGVPTFTKDQLFLAGPVPGFRGLFAMSGCMEAGVTHGPALGRVLAEHAVDGKTHWDSSRYRWDRFKA